MDTVTNGARTCNSYNEPCRRELLGEPPKVGGWWRVAGGWWLLAGGWWLAAGGWRLVEATAELDWDMRSASKHKCAAGPVVSFYHCSMSQSA